MSLDARSPAQTLSPTASGASAPLVRLQHVDKVYANGTVALRDVSLDVATGEFVCLVGPSGCGKSTILRMVAGLGDASAGLVEVDSMSPARARHDRQEMAFVFQDATLLPWRTVQANIELPLELRHVRRQRRRQEVQEAVEFVGLQGFERVYPRSLSGGMRMRVSLARALVAKPKLLLMDEPFGALDEMTRQHLNAELLRIYQAAGWTVLFVTHNVFEAVFLSTRIVMMTPRPGQIAEMIDVPAPYPRPASYRTSAEYHALVDRVLTAFKEV